MRIKEIRLDQWVDQASCKEADRRIHTKLKKEKWEEPASQEKGTKDNKTICVAGQCLSKQEGYLTSHCKKREDPAVPEKRLEIYKMIYAAGQCPSADNQRRSTHPTLQKMGRTSFPRLASQRENGGIVRCGRTPDRSNCV